MEQEQKSNGAIIGSIIIIVLLIIGGIYVWQAKMKEVKLEKQKQEEAINASNAELNQIEQELKNTDTTSNIDTSKVQ